MEPAGARTLFAPGHHGPHVQGLQRRVQTADGEEIKKVVAVFAGLFLCTAVCAAEPYVITVQRLELKKNTGEWVKIIEPDHRVDLASTDAVISFFNNGRVPSADFNNFRVTIEDHGQVREISRKEDFSEAVPVKKGSFVNVTFVLDLDSRKVEQLRLTVDDVQRVDSGDTIVMTPFSGAKG